ncbi:MULTISPECIES: DUF4123 domain-containing protein [Caldimonas]|uniref:DUF4123 domain-containing protein n=1 Tax=Caldimonas TaxID=196013 RepID=UPI0003818B28|nr:DUF4123 domain-containing protein [Caldimonas manganoxidans]
MSASVLPVADGFDPRTFAREVATARAVELRQRMRDCHAGVFVLIDPVLGDPVSRDPLPEGLSPNELNDLRSQLWGRSTHGLELPQGVALETRLGPYLIELDGPNDPWLEVTVGWAVQEAVASWTDTRSAGTPHRVGGWLQSAAHVSVLATMLSAWLKLDTDAATTARYLRLADRRVWGLAVHVLGAEHIAQRLAPIHCWHWLDPHATWQRLQAATPAAALHDIAPQPLARFSRKQWAVMMQGPAIHRYLAEEQARRVRSANAPGLVPSMPVSDALWQAALAHASLENKTNQEGPSP